MMNRNNRNNRNKTTARCLLIGIVSLTISAIPIRAALDNAQVETIGFNLQKSWTEMEAMEYRVQWQNGAGTYQAPNRTHNFRVSFYRNGFTAEPRDPRRSPGEPLDTWRIAFLLKSYGARNPVLPSINPRVAAVGNHMEFATSEIVASYTNDTNGLHQTFLVNQRPVDGRLSVDVGVTLVGLEMAMDPNGEFVSFVRPGSGEEVLRYSGLRVFDANSKELPSRMLITALGTISLVVDDTDAVYPVLVDPWLRHAAPDHPEAPLGNTSDTRQPSANFGLSLAYYERMFNGSYFGSVIVGAPYFDNGFTDQGAVFGFLSDANGLPTAPNWTKFGDGPFAYFGYSLAVAQPFNLPDDEASVMTTFQTETDPANSFADLVVGEPGYNNRYGRVFVYYGNSSGLNSVADRTYTGTTAAGEDFGLSAAVGDVDNDGFQDLLVGQPNTGNGTVFLYKGSASGLPPSNSSASGSVTGSSAGEQFGFSIAFAGDVNGNTDGDGVVRNDVLVGAPNFNGQRGKVYLFDGTSLGLAASPYWTDTVTQSGARFGYSVAGNGNIDGANRKDFIVGAPYYDFDGSTLDSGRVYVYRSSLFGGNPQAPDFLDGNHQAGSRLGYAVALGNINVVTDGLVDIIAGAPFYDTNPNDNKGRVFIFWGRSGTSPNPTPDQFESGEATMTGERFGSSVLSVRKVTGPFNNPCVAAGAPFANPSGVSGAGLVELYEYQP